MSNAQFTPKVYQPIKEDGIITNWEWVEMVPGATNEIRGTVFISDFNINNNEPNIFQTEEDCTSFTSVSPVGVRNALQAMALCREESNGDFIVPLNKDIKFIIEKEEGKTEIKSVKDLSNYQGSDTITINDQNIILVTEESLDAKHLNSDTGVIKVGVKNPNTETDLDSSYRFYIQV